MILVLQDLHWIDTASNDILGEMVVDVPALRVLVLVTHREGWSAPWGDFRVAGKGDAQAATRKEASRGDSGAGWRPLSGNLEQYLS